MKKTFLLSIIFIFFGVVSGYILNTRINLNSIETFKEETKYYFLQEGIYSNLDILKENTKKLDVKLINEENNKYYVYLAITTKKETAEKIKKIYDKKGYQTYIKEINLANEEFYNNVIQFDLLIEHANKEEEILTIEEVVLANYEEIIKKQ